MRIVSSLTASLALALSAGCVSVLPEATPASARYTISPVTFNDAAVSSVDWSLAVEDPSATRAYDTVKIAITRAPGQIEYYAGGEWADRSPRLIRTALVRSFENTNRILGVGDTISLPGAQFILQTDIRSLHVNYNKDAPSADVVIFARLTDRRGRILSSRLFEQSQQLQSDTTTQAGRAFDRALGMVIGDIVDWSLEEAETVAGQS